MIATILFFFLHSFQSNAEVKPVYRAVIVSTLPPPLLLSQNGSPNGLVKDYIEALAEEMNVTITTDVLPRLRIDTYSSEGKYDINCYTNQAWNDKSALFLWSKTLFTKKEIIVGNLPLPKSINEFNGQSIGTLLGYKYPALEKAFASKKLKREDTVNEDANIQKLVHGRIPYIITDQLILGYYRKTHPDLASKILKEEIVDDEYPIQCAVYRSSKLSLSKLNAAIDSLISSKKLEKIMSKYN